MNQFHCLSTVEKKLGSSYQPTADELAAMTAILVARYQAERGGKTVTRFRLGRASVRGMGIRTRLRDSFTSEWIEKLAVDYGWATFENDDEFILIRTSPTKQWTRIAAFERLKDIVQALQKGDREPLDDAMSEIENHNCDYDNEEDEA